ncbi:hypothetical protein CLOP_g24728 [Closterium sp. NIES-67]|nr:hypothetical protein CLOP_g24728 [Closterium sp. NIES-67]
MSQSALNLVPPLSVKSPLFSVNSSLFAVNSSPHPAKPSNASVLHPHFTESPRHRQNRIKLKRSESDREATRCAPSVEVLPARCFRVHCHATPRKSGHRRKSQSERASSLVSTPTDKPKGFGGASIRRSDKLDSVANESASDARDPGSNPAVLPSQNSSEQASRLEPATSQRISSLDPVSPQPFPNLRPAIAPEPQAGKASAVTAGSSNGAVRSSRERRKKCGGLSSGHGRRGNLESGAGTTRPRNLESLASKGQGLSADSITPAATSATPAPGDIGFRPLRTGLGSRKRMSRTVTNRVARAVHALVLAARTDSQSPLLLAVKANTSASRAPELTLICDSQSESRMGKESLRELRRLKKLPAAFLRSVAEELWLVREFELAADVLDLIPPATSLGAGKIRRFDLLASQISWQLMVPAQPAERQQPLVGRASSSTPSHPFSTPSPALSYAPGCALIEAFGEVGVVDGSSGPESGEARAAGDIEGQDSRQRDENSQRSSGRELRSSALENGISPHFSSPQPCSRSLKREVHAVLMLAAALARCNRPDDALALLRFVLQSGSATWQAVRGQVAVVAREAEEAVLRALARAKRWGEIEEVVGEMSCLKQQAAGGAEGAEAVATREAEEAVARHNSLWQKQQQKQHQKQQQKQQQQQKRNQKQHQHHHKQQQQQQQEEEEEAEPEV